MIAVLAGYALSLQSQRPDKEWKTYEVIGYYLITGDPYHIGIVKAESRQSAINLVYAEFGGCFEVVEMEPAPCPST